MPESPIERSLKQHFSKHRIVFWYDAADPQVAPAADELLDLLDQMNGHNWRIISQQLFERIQSLRNAP